MRCRQRWVPWAYAALTIASTFLVGQVLLWTSPDAANGWSAVLFPLINLLPMLWAFVFLRKAGESTGVGQFLRAAFPLRERWFAYAAGLAVPLVYYGVSAVLGSVTYTGASWSAALAYFPWALLQGGLEEVGWRWYLQDRLLPKAPLVLKLLLLSGIWYLWHIPVYRLPWVTAGSSNGLVFYLMILGNTFTLGAVRTFSRGAVPCILAHMLLNTGAVLLLVGSSLPQAALLAAAEVLLSLLAVSLRRRNA